MDEGILIRGLKTDSAEGRAEKVISSIARLHYENIQSQSLRERPICTQPALIRIRKRLAVVVESDMPNNPPPPPSPLFPSPPSSSNVPSKCSRRLPHTRRDNLCGQNSHLIIIACFGFLAFSAPSCLPATVLKVETRRVYHPSVHMVLVPA